MSSESTNTEILLTTSGKLTRPAVNALASRGLSDLEATEIADKWLETASEHFSRDVDGLRAVLKSNKINFRTKRGRMPFDKWLQSSEHCANMSAYIDCLRRAVAAKPDYAKPQIKVAEAYLKGWGVSESRDEALRLLRAAAALASPDDLDEMSHQIESEVAGGDPWPEGMREAETWYRSAAEQGHSGAQYSLAKMYCEGEGGLQKNYELAKYWFSKTAEDQEGGFPPAEYLLQTWWDE